MNVTQDVFGVILSFLSHKEIAKAKAVCQTYSNLTLMAIRNREIYRIQRYTQTVHLEALEINDLVIAKDLLEIQTCLLDLREKVIVILKDSKNLLQVQNPPIFFDKIPQLISIYKNMDTVCEKQVPSFQRNILIASIVEGLNKIGCLHKAFEMKTKITNLNNQQHLTAEIAIALARNGQFEKALEESGRITSPMLKDKVLSALSIYHARSEKIMDAIALAENIKDAHYRDEAYMEISCNLAKVHRFIEALNQSDNITNQDYKNRPYLIIATGLAQSNQMEKSKEIVTKVTNQDCKDEATGNIALELAKLNRNEEASALAETIADDGLRESILLELSFF